MLTILRLLLRRLAGQTLRTGDHAWLLWLMSWLVLERRLAPKWHKGEGALPQANIAKQLANLNHHGALASPLCPSPPSLTVLLCPPSRYSHPFDSTETLPLPPWILTLTPTTSRRRLLLAAMRTPATATLPRQEVVRVLAVQAELPRTAVRLPRAVLPMHPLFVVLYAHFLPRYLPGEAGAQSLKRVGSVRTEHSHHGA